MKTFWSRITLQCYCRPGEKPAPWYAYPLALVFIVGMYAVASIGDVAGF